MTAKSMARTAAKAADRRVLRTRKLLQDALSATIVEKGYEAATVQDIIDRANVGRSTFYAHFADKQTLLSSSLEDLRAYLADRQERALVAPGGPDTRGLGFSLPMLEHAGAHLPLYEAILGRESGAFVMQRVHRTIADLAGRDLEALGFTGAPEQRGLAARFIAGAFMAVLTWWLEQGATRPAHEVDVIVRRLVMQGLAAEFGSRPAAPAGQPPSIRRIRDSRRP